MMSMNVMNDYFTMTVDLKKQKEDEVRVQEMKKKKELREKVAKEAAKEKRLLAKIQEKQQQEKQQQHVRPGHAFVHADKKNEPQRPSSRSESQGRCLQAP